MAEDLPTSSAWMRWLRGGVSLAPIEGFLLVTLLQHVTDEMAVGSRSFASTACGDGGWIALTCRNFPFGTAR